MLSLSIYCIAVPQAQHSKAQSARTKPQSKYAPIRVRQRKQADREHLPYCSIAIIAQHSAISPHKDAKQARADQSATTQASRQSRREPVHVVEQLYSTLSSQNEEIEVCPIYKSIQLLSAGVMREGLDFSVVSISIRYNTAFSLRRFYAFGTCMLAGKSIFPFSSFCFRRRAFVSHFFLFRFAFVLCVRRLYRHVVEHHQKTTMSTVLQAQHSTAQHSAVNQHKQQSKYVPIRAPQPKQTNIVGSSPHVVEYL